jgi:hypothetical protein
MQEFIDQDQLVDAIVACAGGVLRGEGSWDLLEPMLATGSRAGAAAPLLWLRTRLGLSLTEERVLWLLLASDLDPDVRVTLRTFSTESACEVSLDVVRRVIYGATAKLRAWRELGSQGKLRRLGLIERVDRASAASEPQQTFKLSRRVLALAHGEIGIDPDLGGVASLHRPAADLSELVVDPAVPERLRASMAGSGHRLIVVHGREGSGRRSVVTGIAKERSIKLLVVDARRLSPDRVRAAEQLRAVARECTLLERTPLVIAADVLGAVAGNPDRLDLLETELEGLVLATSSELLSRRWDIPCLHVELPLLTHRDTVRVWRAALPGVTEATGARLANLYPLAPALIRAVAAVARETACDHAITPDHIQAGVRTIVENRMSGLAKRLATSQSWDDLILAEDQGAALVELLARVRARARVYEDWDFGSKVGRGLGVAALFSGPPGTGKTMAAGLIAKELGLELYVVDLSKIASKWIGETEKNLATIFDAAEAGHAILLFDEADALFAKRSEVKSSNDRNSNLETNYLLQRIESFTGICILTSNHESNIDPAFQRRLSLHLRFQVPDEDEREKLWRAMLPAQAPVDASVDFAGLARRYAMTGGYIKNAALRAAFLAADEGRSIGDAHLEYAARLEYEGMGKIAMPAASWPTRVSATV